LNAEKGIYSILPYYFSKSNLFFLKRDRFGEKEAAAKIFPLIIRRRSRQNSDREENGGIARLRRTAAVFSRK